MIELKEGEVGKLAHFTGSREILIVGAGEVVLLRSLAGNNFPLTDESGEEVVYKGYDDSDVLLNSTISNNCQKAAFSLKCVSGSIKYLVVAND